MNASAARPLLTIAIPTWNRARYLAENLRQLQDELARAPGAAVEIIVSDNCSPDDTGEVVRAAIARGLPVRYARNEQNLGWARNFANACDLARGEYLLLLGDDDLFVDGALGLLLRRLERRTYGVVCLRPFGYDVDFRAEQPGGEGDEKIFTDPNRFLVAISQYFTLTSALVLKRDLLAGVPVRQFIDTDLATFHLLLRAALAAPENLYLRRYLIASKRQNSAPYEYTRIFVQQLWMIMDAHVAHGLAPATIRRIERDKLLSYYPFYLFDLRRARRDAAVARGHFEARFGRRLLYRCWLAPILWLPRPLALAWGGAATILGRTLGGDLRRCVRFAWARLQRLSGRARPAAAGPATPVATAPATSHPLNR
jgi:glycosyltransferase involved in cell wall biosynthesis